VSGELAEIRTRENQAAPVGSLIDLLDRLLEGGVVIQGDLTLAAAEIDLVRLDLRLLVAAIDKAAGP
jgi:hypothetical protein